MWKKKFDLFFLGAILIIGFLTLPGYGVYLDQVAQQEILYANVKEYLMYLPGEETPLLRQMNEKGILEISANEDKDHGMAAYYPVFFVWYLNQMDAKTGNLFWHGYTFLLMFWGMCCLYFLCKELFQSDKTAAFTVLIFFLTPRMFAENHYNNKDSLLLCLVFVMAYWGWRLLWELSWKNIINFVIGGALAANIKIIGIWTFGILGLYILAHYIATKRFTYKVFGRATACVFLWALFYILLTPASWRDLAGFFRYLIGYAVNYDLWRDYVLFQGRMLHKDYTGIPRKYLPVLMLYTIPVGILISGIAGYGVAVLETLKSRGKKLWEREGYLFAVALTGAVPLAYAVLAATPLYNGWRHLYFVYAGFVMGSGYLAYYLYSRFAGKKLFYKNLMLGIAAGYCAFLATGIALNHPQEHSYFNFLAGKDVVHQYELDYWDMSVYQALGCVKKDCGGTETVRTVGAFNNPTFWGVENNYILFSPKEKEKIKVTGDWREADYVIVNTTYAVMYSGGEYAEVQEQYDMIGEFTSYGNPICQVYRKN